MDNLCEKTKYYEEMIEKTKIEHDVMLLKSKNKSCHKVAKFILKYSFIFTLGSSIATSVLYSLVNHKLIFKITNLEVFSGFTLGAVSFYFFTISRNNKKIKELENSSKYNN